MKGPAFTLRCFLFGHSPSEEMRHGFLTDSEAEFTFCERCTMLFREEDGEWVKNNA